MTKATRPTATTAGQRIRALRIASGLTQLALGKAVGVTQGAISQMEKGDIKNLSGPVLLRMCRRLNTTGEYLLDGRPNIDEVGRTKVLVNSTEAYLLDVFRACSEQDRADIVRGAWLRAKDRAGKRHESEPAPPPNTSQRTRQFQGNDVSEA